MNDVQKVAQAAAFCVTSPPSPEDYPEQGKYKR